MQKILSVIFLLTIGNSLFAQDTLKVRKYSPDDDRYCRLELCARKECYRDTVPLSFFTDDKKPEVRINDDCGARKKTDVFISSFEIKAEINGVKKSSIAQSSFFTDPQLKIIRSLKAGEIFTVSNVVVHAPDGFKKMEDLTIVIK